MPDAFPDWAACGVCLEVLEDPRPCASCTKNACSACLREWLAVKPTCPFCRCASLPGALQPLNRGLRDAIHAVVPLRLRLPRSPAPGAAALRAPAPAPARAPARAGSPAPAPAPPTPRHFLPAQSLLERATPSSLMEQTFDVALLALAGGAYGAGLALYASFAATWALVKGAPQLRGESWCNDARYVTPHGAHHTLFNVALGACALAVFLLSGDAATALACALPACALAAMAALPYSRARAPDGEPVGALQERALRLAQGAAALLLLGQWRLAAALAVALEAVLLARAAGARAGVPVEYVTPAATLALAAGAACLLPAQWSAPLLHFLLLAPLLCGSDASWARATARLQSCDVVAHLIDVTRGVAAYEEATALPRALLARHLAAAASRRGA
jgi:hypothetical protein